MQKYREQDKPTPMSPAENQDVPMNAWQMIIAGFDAEMADGKETFTRNPTQQSVQEEYSIYVMGALSAGSTFVLVILGVVVLARRFLTMIQKSMDIGVRHRT